MVVITSLGPPSEGIHHRQPDCLCFVNKRELGKGEMVVSESRVSWVPNNAQGKQFSLEYPHIAMHAVCYAANWTVIQAIIVIRNGYSMHVVAVGIYSYQFTSFKDK